MIYMYVDYNADGREDLIRFREKTNSWELFLSTPQADGSWRLKIDGVLAYRLMLMKIVFGDVNSDGLVDAIQYEDYESYAFWSSACTQLTVYMLERDTSQPVTSERAYSFSSAITHNLKCAAYHYWQPRNFDYNTIQDMRIADLNGDGKASYWVHLLIRIVAYIYPSDLTIYFICQSTT